MNQNTHHRSNRRAHEKREGAALLIVLFILMMSTATAVYALQSTQYEQRAAGSLQQAMRTKYISEAATVGVLGFCLELGNTGCFDLKHGDISPVDRQRYALPSNGGVEVLTQLTPLDLVGTNWPANALIPSDAQLVPSGGAASPYTPSFMTSMEEWKVPNPGETRARFRMVVSTYGLLGLGAGNVNDVTNVAATDLRGAHESVSATRAFFDVR